MESSKKILLTTIGIAVLIVLASGVTFAFFNYTRTGSSNTIRVGRISFVSKNEQTITLNNLFPIDPTDTSAMNDSTKVGTYSIEIKGDTDYVDGIEYLVSAVDANIYTSTGKTVPISLDIEVDDLGTSNTNYFTARENTNVSIYKKIVGDTLVGDQMLLVGFIKPNTTSGTSEGVNGNIIIKAYLDENNILVSDTYDGTESDNMGTPNSMAEGKTVLTTAEWNALGSNGLSFKIKVEANEGIWVKGSLEEIMRTKNYSETLNRGIRDNESSEFVSAQSGINFGAISSDTNGKGVYMRAGTENDAYPIMYYRGDVNDNNVVFANKCWKAVRTTDTGGIKLIYNGQFTENFPVYTLRKDLDYTVVSNYIESNHFGWSYDSANELWQNEDNYYVFDDALTISFLESGNYQVDYSISGGYIRIKKGDTYILDYNTEYDSSLSLENINAGDEITIESYSGYATYAKIKFEKIGKSPITGCYNDKSSSQISLNISGTDVNEFEFSYFGGSPANSGYMYGNVYIRTNGNFTSYAKYGSSFIWDGTNYKLVDVAGIVPDSSHHYTCNSEDENATCSNLRYIFYSTQGHGTKYYIVLRDGIGIEESLTRMKTNTNDSKAKEIIDTWYVNNLTSYANKLEDTIWCNDRSFGDGNNNGWIANGGDLSTHLYYGSYQRSNHASDASSVKNQPSLVCTNKNDRFTVNNANGNQSLQYPVALLTADEIVLAGGVVGLTNTSFYLTSGAAYWSLSPYYFTQDGQYDFSVTSMGTLSSNYVTDDYGLRPSISIKPGQLITKGIGTADDPYVIE